MHTHLKVKRHGNEIALISENRGRAYLALAITEALVLSLLLGTLIENAGFDWSVAGAGIACFALVGWTASYARPDYKMTIDLSRRHGRLVRIAPLTGERVVREFEVADVDCLSLQQIRATTERSRDFRNYVVSVRLRDGARHVLSTRGPRFAYDSALEKLGDVAGIARRLERVGGLKA